MKDLTEKRLDEEEDSDAARERIWRTWSNRCEDNRAVDSSGITFKELVNRDEVKTGWRVVMRRRQDVMEAILNDAHERPPRDCTALVGFLKHFFIADQVTIMITIMITDVVSVEPADFDGVTLGVQRRGKSFYVHHEFHQLFFGHELCQSLDIHHEQSRRDVESLFQSEHHHH